MRGLAQESTGLDRTLDLTGEIMSVGSSASAQLDGQTRRLKNAGNNLSTIERTAAPRAEKLIGMINKHQKKNTIILAFVISVCLVLTLYSLGFISFLKKLVAATPSLPSSSSSETTTASEAAAAATSSDSLKEALVAEEDTKHTSHQSTMATKENTKQ